MKLALLQTAVDTDKRRNLQTVSAAIEQAAQWGADMVVLPEMFCCPYDNASFPVYAESASGQIVRTLSEFAEKHYIWLVGGSFPEREGEKLYNSCFVFNRQGNQVARHRKVHLFDIDIPGGQTFRESDTLSPGTSATVFETEFGRVGVCICFDLRFPELFRKMALAGAELILVPAAFNRTTGPKHWSLLLRSRAMDYQLFTAGIASASDEQASYVSYGHTILCDPWGSVIQEAGAEEAILTAELDFSMVNQVRRQIPLGYALP